MTDPLPLSPRMSYGQMRMALYQVAPDLHVASARLPGKLDGVYCLSTNTETIYIADDLTPTQYRCVLAHEISHAKHRDRGGHADRYTEQRADIEAARMLISQVEYQTAENIYDGDETLMAKEMNVMPWIIQAYKQWLHDNVAA